MKRSCKNLIWLIVLIALAICTIKVITTQCTGYSSAGFQRTLASMSPFWLAAAIVCAFGFIYFEGAGLRCICSYFGHSFGRGRATLYSASDIYFSALTPSAAGGQPAALLLMVSDSVPTAIGTIALLLNLVMYTLSILLLGGAAFMLCPTIFTGFSPVSKLLVIIGTVVQLVFIVLFLMCIFKDSLIRSLARWALRLLCKLRIIKDHAAQSEKLERGIDEYKRCGTLLRKSGKLIASVFAFNFAQRLSVILVSVCVFIGIGGEHGSVLHAFCAQVFTVLGSNAVPIPGAMGAADYLFIDGFKSIFPDYVSLELISRGISFYATFIFCGLMLAVLTLSRTLRKQSADTAVQRSSDADFDTDLDTDKEAS